MGEILKMSLEDQIFENHYNYYQNVGIETIKINSGQIDQVSDDYQGRVLYELLQNAFDKSVKNILVQVKGNSLYVANDGSKFTFNANHDYKDGSAATNIFTRYDFQSICSISTSTKSVSGNIGNKGVGFKSVYSIADFANIYTKGLIVNNKEILEETISFRLYDSFKNINNVPEGFKESIRIRIRENIKSIQKEENLKNRGVPGYYYPLHILNEEELYVKELFEKGFVTIIEVPFSNKEKVKELFEEIQENHFQFVRIKYPKKKFNITFDFDGEIKKQYVKEDKNRFFAAYVTNPKIHILANAAGVINELPQVAIYIKEKPKGKLYNYLPTQKTSPFKYIDFHADFHTKVDRTDVNFDVRTPIGEYNRALLKACMELYFLVLNSFLEKNEQAELNTEYIDKNTINFKFENFDWRLIEIDSSLSVFSEVTSILGIWNWHYYGASLFFANIAKKLFSNPRNVQIHNLFFNNLIDFIERYTSASMQYSVWTERFKKTLSEILKQKNAQIIPNSVWSGNNELLYRKKTDAFIQLPDYLGINITDFEIKDKKFREYLGINDFTDYNELLKYFKQCAFSGDYNQSSLTENQQKELIKSLYQIYEAKKEQSFLTTHRFTRAYNAKLREFNSSLNQAYFNISTIFLKTYENRYKPAQLCKLNELDIDFLGTIIPEEKRNDFLRFLGVSVDSNYLFTDSRLYAKLKDGLGFIPGLADRKEEKIEEELIRCFNIITPKGNLVHPAIANDNNYSFLENIFSTQVKLELDNILVKRYNEFPVSYQEVLKDRIDLNLSQKNDVVRLYQSVFHLFEKSKRFLIIENGQLSWSNADDFKILSTKSDFDLITTLQSTKILCYYSGSGIPEYLESRLITPKKGKINCDPSNKNEDLKKIIEQKIIFLLISISHSKNSDKKYLEDNVDLGEIQKRLEYLEIYEVPSLEQEIIFNDKIFVTNKEFAIDELHPGIIYIKKDAIDIDKAECISEYLFNNASIKESVELIVFHKDVNTLLKSVNSLEFEIINKKWKTDYAVKFRHFESEIFTEFDYTHQEKENWYIYNSKQKSVLLVRLDNEGKLNELKQMIYSLKLKPEYEGYFNNFDIEIDRSEIEKYSAKLLSFLESTENVKQAEDLIKRVKKLSLRIGSEDALNLVEVEIKQIFPNYLEYDAPNQDSIAKELSIDSRIDLIFGKIGNNNTKQKIDNTSNGDNITTKKISTIPKKLIFQQNGFGENHGQSLELMGANGEEEVLIYYINEFIKLPKEERIIGINAVYQEIATKTKDNSLEKFKTKCLEVIENDDVLIRALIPLFYITMHYKYSYFDLIVYKNKKPVFVEVKTTNGINNNRFFLSIAEVNAARTNENYEIVRVSPNSICFMGNPIKLMEDKIELIQGDKFTLIPRNYEFKFNENDQSN